MDILRNPIVRGTIFVVGVLVWLSCVAVMGLLAASWVDIATEPPHENKLAGIVWFLLGPAIPIGLFVASGLLYASWDRFQSANPNVARAAVVSVPLVGVTFVAGFFFPFFLPVAILMCASLAVHLVSMVTLIARTWHSSGAPWVIDAEQTVGESEVQSE